MIKALIDGIESAMRAKGYVLAKDEDALQDRRYRFVIGELSSANDNRGAMNSGIVRVDRIIELRVQYTSDQKYNRRQVSIAEDQEEIVLAINSISTQTGRFDDASVEEVTGGMISSVRFTFPGQVK